MQPFNAYQRRIVAIMLFIIFISLMLKVVDNQQHTANFSAAGFLNDYEHTAVIDTVKPEVIVSTNALIEPKNKINKRANKKTIEKQEPTIININEADLENIQTLPGIGPVLAQRIIDYRDSIGHFTKADDLLEVRGIGEMKLAKIERYLEFEKVSN